MVTMERPVEMIGMPVVMTVNLERVAALLDKPGGVYSTEVH